MARYAQFKQTAYLLITLTECTKSTSHPFSRFLLFHCCYILSKAKHILVLRLAKSFSLKVCSVTDVFKVHQQGI